MRLSPRPFLKINILLLFLTLFYFLDLFPLFPHKVRTRALSQTSAVSLPPPRVQDPPVTPWQDKDLHLIQLPLAMKNFRETRPVKVAIIDTGIDPSHPLLQNSLFLPQDLVTATHFGMDFTLKDKTSFAPYDIHGHGTHIAGIIKSIYPEAQFLILKYYNPQASGEVNLASSLAALEYALGAGVDIINFSGGGPEPSVRELELLYQAERKGILVVTAAGNEKVDLDRNENSYYPTSYNLPNMISVSAHNSAREILGTANWGKNTVDLFAPGDQILSTLPQGRLGKMTGTSQATAFVTGVASLVKAQFPHFSPKEIKMIISFSAREEKALRNKCKSNGLLDAFRALELSRSYHLQKQNPIRGLANAQ